MDSMDSEPGGGIEISVTLAVVIITRYKLGQAVALEDHSKQSSSGRDVRISFLRKTCISLCGNVIFLCFYYIASLSDKPNHLGLAVWQFLHFCFLAMFSSLYILVGGFFMQIIRSSRRIPYKGLSVRALERQWRMGLGLMLLALTLSSLGVAYSVSSLGATKEWSMEIRHRAYLKRSFVVQRGLISAFNFVIGMWWLYIPYIMWTEPPKTDDHDLARRLKSIGGSFDRKASFFDSPYSPKRTMSLTSLSTVDSLGERVLRFNKEESKSIQFPIFEFKIMKTSYVVFLCLVSRGILNYLIHTTGFAPGLTPYLFLLPLLPLISIMGGRKGVTKPTLVKPLISRVNSMI